jgi:membrane-bound lytic murein transglycosylase MltF
MKSRMLVVAGLIAALMYLAACGRSKEDAAATKAAAPKAAQPPAAAAAQPTSAVSSAAQELPQTVSDVLFQKWTGDLDGMIKRRIIRAGVVFSRTHYFIDKGMQRGAAYESLKLFEEDLNVGRKPDERVHVVFVPLTPDALLPALLNGEIDLASAMIIVTPERQKLVDFSPAMRTGVSEIVVTGPGAPAISSLDDLAGQAVFVRKSSSQYDGLVALNARFTREHKPPVQIELAPESLEPDDLLEMVNAGLVKITVVHDFFAQFWSKVLPNLRLHPDAALSTGGQTAVAMRKNSPQLMAATTAWVNKNGPRTMFGNLMTQRYLKSAKYVRDATSETERKKFDLMLALFRKYGEEYQIDYLLMAAQAYQESRLDQSVKSSAGAVGVMQLLPSTGKDMKVGDIRQVEPNIHAGVKYIRFMIDEYFSDQPMTPLNKGLFAFASYNAGPARIRQLRAKAATRGLDPNIWFNNVERIASEEIGRETVQYVSNIFKYYVAYKLVLNERKMKRPTT